MARETDLEQRERKDQETSDYREARQVRLGHIPEKKKKAAAPKEKSPEETE